MRSTKKPAAKAGKEHASKKPTKSDKPAAASASSRQPKSK
jgi:hypothetical protein